MSTSATGSSRSRRRRSRTSRRCSASTAKRATSSFSRSCKRGEHEASGEADLALRYDLTVPLARVVAQYQNELPRFFKRYQIQPVWRADRPARGRFREFYQCDIDAMGSTSPVVEAEVLGAVSEILTTLGFADFAVRLNHRARADGAARGRRRVRARCTATRWWRSTSSTRSASKAWRRSSPRAASPRRRARRRWTLFTAAPELPEAALQRLQDLLPAHDGGRRTCATIVRLAGATPAARPDPARSEPRARAVILHGRDHGDRGPNGIGSLGGGGRYDNLIGMFLGRDVPACGFSLGLERIIVVMTEREHVPGGGAARRRGRDGDLPGRRVARPRRCGWRPSCAQSKLRVDVFPEAGRSSTSR